MAKKLTDNANQDATTESPVQPQLTFTEAEVQGVADFVNFVYRNGDYKLNMADARKLTSMLTAMHHHIAKIEKYIFEYSRNLTPKKVDK